MIATGRTHQIRVHLKYKGTPVLGDSLYGNSSLNHYYGVERQLLHAGKMKFQHPFTGEQLDLSAPPPEDMEKFIRSIKASKERKYEIASPAC